MSPKLTVTPFPPPARFGVELAGADLMNLDDETFMEIQRLVYTHKLVTIRGQKNLTPKGQKAFCMRFDPTCLGKDGVPDGFVVPCADGIEAVRLVGVGEFPEGHYGNGPLSLKAGSHLGFHKEPLTAEEMAAGDTRFQRWHMDGPFYANHLAKVTSLWCHTSPKSEPKLRVRWDDGSGTTMMVTPGTTAFISAVDLYASLSDEDKKWVDHSSVTYAGWPYGWMSKCKALSNGFGLVSEGAELPYEKLPPVDPTKVFTLPMVWVSPVTGEKSLMFHATIAEMLHVKESVDGPETTITDLAELRTKLYNLQRPFLIPENIVCAPHQEGDLNVWSNREMRHSAVDLPPAWGNRMMHQVQLVASDSPANPDPIPGLSAPKA